MQATNQYKQQSNFKTEKSNGLDGRTVNTRVWSSNPGLAKLNPLRLGLSCLIYFSEAENYLAENRLGFAFYNHLVAFVLK